jgi:hypothetical protein
MRRPGKITGPFLGAVLCLAILAPASPSFALTYMIYGDDDRREEWHGPGDPEGGDRYIGDLIIFDPDGSLLSRSDVSAPDDPRETVPQIRVIRLGFGVLLIIESGDEPRAYPMLLSR